jgi:hypothetical protein
MIRVHRRTTFRGLFFLCSLAMPPAFLLAQQQVKPESWNELLSFEDRDLTKIGHRRIGELAQLIESILPKSQGVTFGFGPYCLSRIANDGHSRLVLVECQPLMVIPGLSKARISVFDTEGHFLNSVEFQAGWRITIAGARILKTSPLGVPLIEILSHNVINGRDVARQIYGLIDDDVVLLRLEDSKSRILRNEYVASNWTIGPITPERPIEDWTNSLMSDNPIDVLRTLVWLGGKHWDLKETSVFPGDPRSDVKKEAEYVNNVRAVERIQNRVKSLLESKNQWIREAAALACKPEDGDTYFRNK